MLGLIGYPLAAILIFNGFVEGETGVVVGGVAIAVVVLLASFLTSPYYKIINLTNGMSLGEVALFMMVLSLKNGSGKLNNASRAYCEHFMESLLSLSSVVPESSYRRAIDIAIKTDKSYLVAGKEIFKKFNQQLTAIFFGILSSAVIDKKSAMTRDKYLEIASFSNYTNEVSLFLDTVD